MGRSKKGKSQTDPVGEDDILKAIRSLGGDQDDLDLINGVSDDEDDVLVTNQADLEEVPLTKKELSKFLGGLGFNKIVQKLIIDKDDEEDEQQSDSVVESATIETQPPKPKHSRLAPTAEVPVDESDDEEEPFVRLATGQSVMSIIATDVKRQAMIIKPGGKWYEKELTGIDIAGIQVKREKLPQDQITKLQDYAAKLMKHDLEKYKQYQSSNKNRSNFHWIETVQKSGTLNDRMAAYIVLVQDSPVHNLEALDVLIKMVNVKNNREGLMAVDTLKDLYIGDLLPESRRLMTFDQHPLQMLEHLCGGNRSTFDGLMLLWYFESLLKRCYIEFVMALGRLAKDTLETNKNKAIKTMFSLLVACPEQEQLLLNNLVNKLGDPNKKLASMGSHLLCRLVESHSNMKGVVANEVERLLFRTNVEPQARYFSVCFLNQIMLDDDDRALAAKLVSIYFALFKALTKHDDVNSRMMSALLTGVNRAFPYAHLNTEAFTEQVNATYRIVQVSTFNVAVQALLFLYHALASRNELTDRYYTSLYRKLLDSELINSSKQALFLNLLYKSLKKDTVDTRRLAFIKRLFQISFCQMPSMVCGSLFLVSEVLRETSKSLPLASTRLAMLDDQDDDEERLKDEDSENEDDATPAEKGASSTWVHRTNQTTRGVDHSDYNPWNRNPSFAAADKSCAWELAALSRHYHPSVALFARTLTEGNPIQYNGDPLQDFTLARFLDRFVYRNPKKPSAATREGRQAPLLQHTVLGKRRLYTPKGARAFPANSVAFMEQSKRSVPVDEMFFYKYFGEQRRLATADGVVEKVDNEDSDGESVASDDFERLLEKIEPGALMGDKDLDFVSDIRAGRGGKKGKRGDSDSDDDEDDEEVDFEDDDFDEEFREFDEDIKEAKEFQEEDTENDSDAEDGDPLFKGMEKVLSKGSKSSKRPAPDNEESDEDLDFLVSKKSRPNKEEKSFDSRSLFASAEEFSNILDENAMTSGDTGGSEAMANRDRSHVKQLMWEQERDRWVRGADWKTRKRRSGGKSGPPKKAGGGRLAHTKKGKSPQRPKASKKQKK